MARGSLNFFERHVEKIVLGLAAGFAIYVFVAFFVLSPNEKKYNNQSVAPGGLREAILTNAKQLESRVRAATPAAEPVPNFATKIEKEFASGVLQPTEQRAALPRVLAQTAPFGEPLPQFGDQQEQTNVVLVTPLKPESPGVSTGRALVIAKRPQVPAAAREGGSDANREADQAVEKAWATVAAWYPADAMRKEMIDAGYAPFRASVYLTGVEAQRQELLATGEWGEWEDVTLSGAMPQYDIPPAVMDSNGLIQNKTELDEAYKLVLSETRALVQPAFYPIRRGDAWRLPALDGLDAARFAKGTDLPVNAEPVALAAAPEPPRAPAGRAAAGRELKPAEGEDPPAAPPERPARRGGRERAGEGRERNSEGPDPRAARKAMTEKLEKAEQALRAKEWEEARATAMALKQEGKLPNEFEERTERVIERAMEGIMSQKILNMQELLEHPAQKGKIAIWFHDDSVEAGKTYRYHIRPTIWNRYVGRAKAVKNPEDASKSVIRGEWSLSSPPITIAPDTHFFVSGASLPARIEVFKWQSGDWKSESFEVGVGEVIGAPRRAGATAVDFTTGAVVIDVREDPDFLFRVKQAKGRFEHRNGKTIVVTYLDAVDGRVKQIHYEKYNTEWVRLREAAEAPA